MNYVLYFLSTFLLKKRSVANSNTKCCDYTIMGVAKGALEPWSHFHTLPTNRFAKFAIRSYYGRVNMVMSSSKCKQKQSVWLLICHFDSFRSSVWLLRVKKIWQPCVWRALPFKPSDCLWTCRRNLCVSPKSQISLQPSNLNL